MNCAETLLEQFIHYGRKKTYNDINMIIWRNLNSFEPTNYGRNCSVVLVLILPNKNCIVLYCVAMCCIVLYGHFCTDPVIQIGGRSVKSQTLHRLKGYDWHFLVWYNSVFFCCWQMQRRHDRYGYTKSEHQATSTLYHQWLILRGWGALVALACEDYHVRCTKFEEHISYVVQLCHHCCDSLMFRRHELLLSTIRLWKWSATCILAHLSLASFLSDICKQWRTWSATAEGGVWSGSVRFAYRMYF